MQLVLLSSAVEMVAEQEINVPVEAAEPQIMERKSSGSAAPGRKVADLEQSLHCETPDPTQTVGFHGTWKAHIFRTKLNKNSFSLPDTCCKLVICPAVKLVICDIVGKCFFC